MLEGAGRPFLHRVMCQLGQADCQEPGQSRNYQIFVDCFCVQGAGLDTVDRIPTCEGNEYLSSLWSCIVHKPLSYTFIPLLILKAGIIMGIIF